MGQIVDGQTLGGGITAVGTDNGNQFVLKPGRIAQGGLVAEAFNQPQIDVVADKGLFDVGGVAADKQQMDIGITCHEAGQQAGEHVLADGGAGTEAEMAAAAAFETGHVVVQRIILFENLFFVNSAANKTIGTHK